MPLAQPSSNLQLCLSSCNLFNAQGLSKPQQQHHSTHVTVMRQEQRRPKEGPLPYNDAIQ